MKTTSSNEDDGLGELLTSWKVEPSLPSRFREHVWHRIAREEKNGTRSLARWRWLIAASGAELLRKPVGALAYASVLLTTGILAGIWSADHYADHTEAAWRAAYLQAVTPTPSLPDQP